MKSIIVLLLTGLASASAFATPVPFEPATSLDGADGVQPDGVLWNGALTAIEWDTLSFAPAIELNPGPIDMVFQHRPRFSKMCLSDRMNAWGFGTRCSTDDDRPQSVPEPGTLVLLGAGLFLLALAQRRRRFQATAGR